MTFDTVLGTYLVAMFAYIAYQLVLLYRIISRV